MATPKSKYRTITVDRDSYETFLKNKMEYMRKNDEYNLTHGEFVVLCIAAYKKGVN